MKATAGVGRVTPSESVLRFLAAFLLLVYLAGVLRISFIFFILAPVGTRMRRELKFLSVALFCTAVKMAYLPFSYACVCVVEESKQTSIIWH